MKIRCMWSEGKRFVTNPDGQIWPCCYLCNSGFVAQYERPNQTKPFVMEEYEKHKEELNLKSNDLKSILNHRWFTEVLPSSWENEGQTLQQCKEFCGEEE